MLLKKPEPLPYYFLTFRDRSLKAIYVGDVNLSHSLGIVFGCAGYESNYNNNADGWYD
jgi:hypothetical protein